MTVTLAVDTSVAVPLLARRHAEHDAVRRWWAGRRGALAGHAVVETYAVLTRLPGPLRVEPADAARLLAARFGPPLPLPPDIASELPDRLAAAQVQGGATYDALVGLAAAAHDVPLATRDRRARATYEAVGARVLLVPMSAPGTS